MFQCRWINTTETPLRDLLLPKESSLKHILALPQSLCSFSMSLVVGKRKKKPSPGIFLIFLKKTKQKLRQSCDKKVKKGIQVDGKNRADTDEPAEIHSVRDYAFVQRAIRRILKFNCMLVKI